ncbi:unnamed protein product [Trichobilharzia regenti]|nr:unnamed protein product [Trichobilharzia regenti]
MAYEPVWVTGNHRNAAPDAAPMLCGLDSKSKAQGKLTPQLTRVKFASCKLLGGIYFKLNRHAEGIDLLSKVGNLSSHL